MLAVLLVAVAAYFAFTIKLATTEATASTGPTSTEPAESRFSFTGTDGWRQGPTNGTSMALFQNGQGCFASVEYKKGMVDVAAEREKQQSNDAKVGVTSTQIGSLAVTLQSDDGQKQYQLHQYSASGEVAGQKIKGGQAFGYLQLTDGYLEVEAHCDTADQLPSTIPALRAIKLTI